MLKEEIKEEINKVLDSLPDKALRDLLDYLKAIKDDQSFLNEGHLRKILLEDKQLLQRLAK